MRITHNVRLRVNIELLRTFFDIVDAGSLNRAAERRQVSQSTLTRQLRALEDEIGGPLFERSASGVALTATGHVLRERMTPLLAKFDAALGEVRKLARGQSAELRIGYIASAAHRYLNTPLAALRRRHPEVKVKLLDLSPGEQIAAMRRGEIDLGLLGLAAALPDKEFYVRRIASFPMLAVLPSGHPLANVSSLTLRDLRSEMFIGAQEQDMPGHNRWIAQACRKAGFRAHFLEDAQSLSHGLSLVVTEGAVSLIPEYAADAKTPGVTYVPLKPSTLRSDLFVAWQRGRASDAVRAILAEIFAKPAR